MKATGIVRRIDHLGRVVIPRELRRSMHICDGDPLEIHTGTNDEIIFTKYSPLLNIRSIAQDVCDGISKAIGNRVIITDNTKVIAEQGTSGFKDKNIHATLKEFRISKNPLFSNVGQVELIEGDVPGKYGDELIIPIVCDNNVFGIIVIFAAPKEKIHGSASFVANSAAIFIAKYINN